MKKICVIGSINVDIVFSVDAIARPGETVSASATRRYLGGKGQNQAIALRRAYPEVALAGNIGASDAWIRDELERQGIDTALVRSLDAETGSAFIQVDSRGQNCIVLDRGANHKFDKEGLDRVLASLKPGDLVVLQNEINLLEHIVRGAKERGIAVALNPSPFDRGIRDLPLRSLDFLVLNEIEGEGLTGESESAAILDALRAAYPETTHVLTLGSEGAMCRAGAETFKVEGRKVDAIDTTAAGDTFLGYFLAEAMLGRAMPDALRRANVAAAISVTRPGAAASIPSREEVDAVDAAGRSGGESRRG